MSFIQSSVNELGSPAELLFRRPGSDKRIMPKQQVLSSSVYFVFVDPVSKEEVSIFEAESINKTKIFNERKSFKPFGYSSNILLVDDKGWEIRISGKKTDAILSYLIYLQEKSLNGASNIAPNFNANANGAEIAGMKPELQIKEIISYLPNSKGEPTATEEYIYTDVTLFAYSESIEGDNSPIGFDLSCYAANRELISIPFEVEKVGNIVTNIINDLLNRNKQ
jgi:hypothetical protein